MKLGSYKAKKDVTIWGSFLFTDVYQGQVITITEHDEDEGYCIEVGPMTTIQTHDTYFINNFEFLD